MKKINFRTFVRIFVAVNLIVNTVCLVSKSFREWFIDLPDKNLVFWKRVFCKTKELFLKINQLIRNAIRKRERAEIKFNEDPRKYYKLSEEWRKKIEEAETIKLGEIYQKENGVYDVK